jgi:nitroimidazol reductase NimA-like FMN-containing flavoprotein (pyridoxamine 5'-phosphate oxidase superfamily)
MREVKRKDRILEDQRALEVLTEGEYGFLAMANVDGGGYGIPMNYVYDGTSIYMHCALEGHKLENLNKDNRVTFTVVVNTEILPSKFSTRYQSVMVSAIAHLDVSDDEKFSLMRLIVNKYSPGFTEPGEKYIQALFAKTRIIRLEILDMKAKTRS